MASINVKTPHSGSVTYEGGNAFRRSPKQELFLLAASFLNEPKFYESANEQVSRIDELAEAVANDGKWILDLVTWLRGDGGLRTSAQVVAAACVHARLKLGIDSKDGLNRKIISASIHRADEGPALLAFYIDRYGKNVPKPVKRGVADALNRMNESQYLKYRGKGKRGAVSIADAISIAHPSPKDELHAALFAYALCEQRGEKPDTAELPLIAARTAFEKLPTDIKVQLLLDPESEVIDKLKLTHEYVFSAIADASDDAKIKIWENMIPTMGYQACLMNARRITELCDNGSTPIDSLMTKRALFNRLADPDKAGYKVMPLSFLAAYRNVQSEVQSVLSANVGKTIDNVPALYGRTLILVDKSGSMAGGFFTRSTVSPFDNACMFATALAYKSAEIYGTADVSMYTFDCEPHRIELNEYISGNKSMLEALDAFGQACGGTRVAYCTNAAYADCQCRGEHIARVIVITDEQTSFTDNERSSLWYPGDTKFSLDTAVPHDIPLYVWNVGGYRPAIDMGSRNRIALGGLTDSAFKLIRYAESCGDSDSSQQWPWDDDVQ